MGKIPLMKSYSSNLSTVAMNYSFFNLPPFGKQEIHVSSETDFTSLESEIIFIGLLCLRWLGNGNKTQDQYCHIILTTYGNTSKQITVYEQ